MTLAELEQLREKIDHDLAQLKSEQRDPAMVNYYWLVRDTIKERKGEKCYGW